MHKLEVKLKQHTPLIHFQHDQEGATIRASEVKPRLDRFILSETGKEFYDKITDDEFEEVALAYEHQHPGKAFDESLGWARQSLEVGKYVARKEGWFNSTSGHLSLNYKLSFLSSSRIDAISLDVEQGRNNKYNTYYTDNNRHSDFPLLLSNMGGKEKVEDLCNLSFYRNVYATFLTPSLSLSKTLTTILPLFFALNNFGQRKDKGFGSFTVLQINGQQISSPSLAEHGVKYRLSFKQNYNATIPYFASIFHLIDFYWKCLKSGINYTRNGQYPQRYIKAYLWTYLNLNEHPKTWEKRRIKEHFNLRTGREITENPNQPFFARALLGAPDKFEYRNFQPTRTIRITHNEDPSSDYFIARIHAPLIFKPVINDNSVTIYLIPDSTALDKLKEYTNLQFKFFEGENELLLDVDSSAITDVNKFISGFHSYISKYARKAFRSDEEYNDYLRNYDLEEDSCRWFIPLDYNWRRIISGPVFITQTK